MKRTLQIAVGAAFSVVCLVLAIRGLALERIPLDEVRSQGYNFQIEMALRCQKAGLRVAELPLFFRERDAGVSKMTPQIALEALWRLWQLRWLVR